MHRLGPVAERRLRAAPLTYAPVTGSLADPLPRGYDHVVDGRVVGHGRAAFERVSAALSSWTLHEAAGLKVRASSASVRLDDVVVLRLGLGPVGVSAPCRVVAVLDDPLRHGFAYGTLPGHPERGEEAFVVTIDPVSDQVRVLVTAFSRPAPGPASWGAPVARAVQRWQTRRYVDAAQRFAG